MNGAETERLTVIFPMKPNLLSFHEYRYDNAANNVAYKRQIGEVVKAEMRPIISIAIDKVKARFGDTIPDGIGLLGAFIRSTGKSK